MLARWYIRSAIKSNLKIYVAGDISMLIQLRIIIHSISTDIKMLCFIVGVVMEFLLVAEVVASSTEKCNAIGSNTCVQQCSDTSCKCGVTYGDLSYTTCNQACQGPKCKVITCSSGNCFQRCHNCQMECTSEVDHCRQHCLSGVCSFKCNARRCERVQECVTCQMIYPLSYLVILACLFAAMSILSFMLLVMSCTELEPWSSKSSANYKYARLRNSTSTESFYSIDAIAA